MYSGKQISKRTMQDYQASMMVLERYRPATGLQEITPEWLRNYEYYLANIAGRAQNSRYHDFAMLRRFLNLARKEGLIKAYPFDHFKFKPEETVPDFLLENELDMLVETFEKGELSDPVARTTANFLFSCMTGVSGREMRDKDCIRFEGGKIIFYPQKKRIRTCSFRYTGKAAALWEIVKEQNLKQHHHRVNLDLETALKAAGITKK
ncbi:MAG: hypothetical protein HC831_28875 [Chloroflexia bacterium]|nr:hypothetical protein [Chloroflexia bacterium]